MKNRILRFIPDKVAIAKRLSKKLVREARSVEAVIGKVAEFCVPSPSGLLDGKRTVSLFLTIEADSCDIRTDLREFAQQQLRGMARELSAAADRLSGGAE